MGMGGERGKGKSGVGGGGGGGGLGGEWGMRGAALQQTDQESSHCCNDNVLIHC